MEFLTNKKDVYELTPQALDMINANVQLHTVSYAILFGLLAILIVLVIFKS